MKISYEKITVKVSLLILLTLFTLLNGVAAQEHKHPEKVHHAKGSTAHKQSYHQVGHRVKMLPAGHRKLLVHGRSFYFYAGVFYRALDANFIMVNAPLGARRKPRPVGYIGFNIGTKHYFHFNSVYYLQEKGAYVVVEKPVSVLAKKQGAQGNDHETRLVIYPELGQSNQQRNQDKYACYQWAVAETGFDPLENKGTVNKNHYQKNYYQKAFVACLQGRDYTVN